MKKIVLSLMGAAMCAMAANAQTRMTLHEEFTGENCPPCASTNPTFWSLCDGGTNPTKLIHISYMVPIPTAGFYCNRTTAIYTSRDAYYAVPFAPYGRYDGNVPDPTAGDPGHPGYFVQADIDAEAARADSFTFSPLTSVWSSTYDSVITTVTITAGSTGWSGTTPKLRVALIQTNDFASSPGTNGETHFENVVQQMYPDVNGSAMPATWAAGESHTYTIAGRVPAYVDKSQSPYMVVWLQDDGNKNIAQAGQTPILTIPYDVAIGNQPSTNCVTGTSGSIAPSVKITNTAAATITSATIYYQVDGGTMMSQPWTGSLATGATTDFTLPAVTVASGAHTIYDSIAVPNGLNDINTINNGATTVMLVQSTTASALPLTTDFESALPASWALFDANGNGENFKSASAPNHATGSKAVKHDNYDYPSGEANFIILPTPAIGAHTLLTFWVAYAQYSTENDMLEVVTSSDCGLNWTSIWSKSGSDLSTAAAITSAFTPTATQWRQEGQDLSSVAAGSIVALRGTSDFGNNLYVDDIRVASVVAVNQVAAPASSAVTIYPNPAKDNATLSFTLSGQTNVQVSVVDELGRTLSVVASEVMTAGAHTLNISTQSLATGVYNVLVHTDGGTNTQHLSVVK